MLDADSMAGERGKSHGDKSGQEEGVENQYYLPTSFIGQPLRWFSFKGPITKTSVDSVINVFLICQCMYTV